MRSTVCKIKCRGVCTVDMNNVCQQLEERTGGKIIYRHFGTVYLFRGRNYNYETRPRFPLMWWRPVSPVYPKLIKRVPKGLTLDEATEMRQKGRVLMPIRKLAKNGVYWDLVTNVREAFEQCDLVRINCQELNTSDYKKIGAKLKAAIVNSQTLEEVARLEKALKSGQLPADIKGLNNNIVLGNVAEKPEDMIPDDRGQADVESNGTQKQTNTDSTSMEQLVMVLLWCNLTHQIAPPTG